MRQRDAKHTLRKSPFVRRTTPRSSGTVACWPTRVLLLCLYLVVFYYAFPKNARPSPSRLGFFRRFFRKGAKSREKQDIRSDVLLFSGTPDWSRTSGLTLRRRSLYPAELPGHRSHTFRGTARAFSLVIAAVYCIPFCRRCQRKKGARLTPCSFSICRMRITSRRTWPSASAGADSDPWRPPRCA